MNDPSAAAVREVVVTSAGEDDRAQRRVASAAALSLSVGLAEATQLLSVLPVTLPKGFTPEEAQSVVERLTAAGAAAAVRARVDLPPGACADHPSFDACGKCGACGAYLCALCVNASPGGPGCAQHARSKRRSRAFYRVRVTLLLGVLALVVLFALFDMQRRGARNDWKRPLTVAFVLVRRGPVDQAAVDALIARAPDLEQRMADELAAFRDTSIRPFTLVPYGPVDAADDPPEPASEGVLDLAAYAYDRVALGAEGRAADRAGDRVAALIRSVA